MKKFLFALLTIPLAFGCNQSKTAISSKDSTTQSSTVADSSRYKTNQARSTAAVKTDSAVIIKKLAIGSWAPDTTNKPDFKIGETNVLYIMDHVYVPYVLAGDSLLFKSVDYSDHYKLIFKGRDTMLMVGESTATRFHRVKD